MGTGIIEAIKPLKMEDKMKRFKWLIWLLLSPIIAFTAFMLYIVTMDYRPDWVEESESIIRNGKPLDVSKPLEITTFNIGYAGLDKSRDFFMDGGTMSRSASEEQTKINLDGVINFMKAKKSDIYLLQEVDIESTRSYEVDQLDVITNLLSGYNASFAYNYKAKWVPVPVLEPMGFAKSGILTLSRGDYESSKRFRLPGDEPIPKRYFDLKRCVMENRYKLSNGKELIVINLHLSAYDKGGTIRAQQLAWLTKHLAEIYDKNKNYVVIGGDWNHILSEKLADRTVGEKPEWVAVIPDTLTTETGFRMVYDEKVNTVRNNDKPYVKGENFECIIDGFLVSPNVKVLKVKGTDMSFEYSDHQPVSIQIGF